MLNVFVLVNFLYKIFPKEIINNHAYSIQKFISKAAKECNKKNKKVLDIGAGELPYKGYFDKCGYFTQDIVNYNGAIDYVSDAKTIPVKDRSFDYIICTQVMEHVKEPHLVIREMYRILKKGGKVFLTTHGNFEEHGIPYDFFRYTRYGLKYLAISNHFRSAKIKPQGGRFIAVSKFIQTLIPRVLKNKYLVYLYYFFAMIPIFIIHLVFFYLDKLDKDKSLTLNYECIFVK
ncbi:hypothetical protein A2866_04005 [Candidatus Roizmanbacteria bacterium RIFCSPHIGHO2_01_FULL_39_8]|uniref:Methyltransferase type 11 domain-containing protein n=3 Tax=Candidatus Roizmaniibacteriota TaxID=1752723 RepID=A0A1F7GPM0_9BACT|nr:MAG: hypothetical protein A2866_04005 [Candidatus Roizmanbacteria bacterium RIFCSPHIGHO2_01_FULL_39_8]OGK26613.1 MAG: hypothetical protein A3C28_03855 [Candidatus Roizmanbacteria bacterium RIFCSPHIGHO2_02_FULL_39_9]OGK35177.1 MAG: hypothetical protein A3F60_02805 [Candidatus Roizmanbacteria bacterium RIFCSPHIGHO2_12_FULL_39_8]